MASEEMGGFGAVLGLVLILIILFAVFGGNFGNRNRDNYSDDYGFQNYKATCDAEKTEIINTARTQYLTEQQAAATRELINAQSNAIGTKIDFYEYQKLRDSNAEKDRKIMELTNQIFVKDQLAPVNAQLADIRCNMLPKPEVTGVGVACPSQAILNGLGVTAFNRCGCNNGNLI